MVDTLGRELLLLSTEEPTSSAGSGSDDSGSGASETAIPIAHGATVVLTPDAATPPSSERLPVNFARLAQLVGVGDRMVAGRYLNTGSDGCSLHLKVGACYHYYYRCVCCVPQHCATVASKVTELRGADVVCEAENDVQLTGLCTLVVVGHDQRPGSLTELPLLSAQDEAALRHLAGRYDVDYVAVSYACNGDDMEEMRTFLDQVRGICGIRGTVVDA